MIIRRGCALTPPENVGLVSCTIHSVSLAAYASTNCTSAGNESTVLALRRQTRHDPHTTHDTRHTTRAGTAAHTHPFESPEAADKAPTVCRVSCTRRPQQYSCERSARPSGGPDSARASRAGSRRFPLVSQKNGEAARSHAAHARGAAGFVTRGRALMRVSTTAVPHAPTSRKSFSSLNSMGLHGSHGQHTYPRWNRRYARVGQETAARSHHRRSP